MILEDHFFWSRARLMVAGMAPRSINLLHFYYVTYAARLCHSCKRPALSKSRRGTARVDIIPTLSPICSAVSSSSLCHSSTIRPLLQDEKGRESYSFYPKLGHPIDTVLPISFQYTPVTADHAFLTKTSDSNTSSSTITAIRTSNQVRGSMGAVKSSAWRQKLLLP